MQATNKSHVIMQEQQHQLPPANIRLLQVERRLTAIYFICAALSVIALVTSAVVFGYWHDTLNSCMGQEELGYRHCGCILYASSTYRTFMGGTTPICHFVEYANIPGIVLGLTLGFIHWYRISFTLKRQKKAIRRRRIVKGAETEAMNPRSDINAKPKSNKCAVAAWLSCAIILFLECVLVIAAAVMLTDGTLKACNEYRKNIIETVSAGGNMAALINDRLFCSAIFSFMDYLEPIKYRQSTSFINTGAALYVDIFAMWFAAAGWVIATITCIYESCFHHRSKCCAGGETGSDN